MMNARKSILAVLVVILLLASLMVGCATKTAPDSEPAATAAAATAAPPAEQAAKPDESYFIGLNIGYPDSEFFQMVEYGIKKAFDELGWTYMVTYGTNEKITENAATLIAQGVNALVDFGCNDAMGSAAVQLADAAGIPVICIDVQYNGAYFFGANNGQAGTVLGETMADWITKHWDGQLDGIFVIYGSTDGDEVNKRTGNAAAAIEKALGYGADIEFKYDCAITQGDGAKQALLDYLSAHPDYKHVACVSVTEIYMPMLMGSVETVGRADNVCYGTHSETSWTFDHFATTDNTDTFVGTVAYDPAGYGNYIVKMLQEKFNGGTLPEKTQMEHYVITRDNYERLGAEYNEAVKVLKGGS